MIAYQTDGNGVYVGEVVADPSPLEPNVYLYPHGAVAVPPPALEVGELARWTGASWVVEVVPIEPEPEPEPEPQPTVESVKRDRLFAYIEEADPLYFEWQRGDATEQDWLNAVQAVKDAHPYPDVP